MKKFLPKLLILCIWVFLFVFLTKTLTKKTAHSTEQKTLHIFSFPEQFSSDMLFAFKQETGIEVVVHNFVTNEELIAKLSHSLENCYDLVTPSDYAVNILHKSGKLEPLDKSKLDFIEALDPFVLDRAYDPKNIYSIPYDWEIFGFGIQDKALSETPSWDLVFNQKKDLSIAMTNDLFEALNFGSFYLFGEKKSLTLKEQKQLKDLLISQKTKIEAYTAIRGDYFLLSDNCKLAVAPSSYLIKAVKQDPSLHFVLPKEGTFVTIENIAIPKGCKNKESVYQFLNFIYQFENQKKECSYFLTFPARLDALKASDTPSTFKKVLQEVKNKDYKVYTVDTLMAEPEARKTWVEIKAI